MSTNDVGVIILVYHLGPALVQGTAPVAALTCCIRQDHNFQMADIFCIHFLLYLIDLQNIHGR